eukprot:56705_1
MGVSDGSALVINGIFSISLLILAVLITVYHLIATYKTTKNLCNKVFIKKHPSIILSYFLVFIACISGLSLTLDSVLTSELCVAAQYYGPTLYSIFKTIIYLILGCRIYISFKNSIYAYNTKGLIAWSILLITWTLFNVISGNLTVQYKIESEAGNTKCLVTPSVMYIISQALLDVTAGAVNCFLFVRPICKLYKLSNDNVSIKKIAYKQCILSLIAIISSILSMAGIGNIPNIVPVFVALDMLISTLCVVLMYKWNSYIAEIMFYCCMPKETKVRMDELQVVPSTTTNINSNTQNSGNSNTPPQHQHHVISASTTVTKTNATNRPEQSQLSLPQPSNNSRGDSDETKNEQSQQTVATMPVTPTGKSELLFNK